MFTTQLQKVTNLWANVQMPFDWRIAGGAARDIRVGLTPKDFDVIVVGPQSDTEAFELVKQLSRQVSMIGGSSQCLMAYGQSADPTIDFVERLYACLKVQLFGDNFDFLIQRATSISEAIGWFDCNLNQYALSTCGSVIEYHGTHPENELHFLKPVRQVRVEKMTKFFNEHIKQ